MLLHQSFWRLDDGRAADVEQLDGLDMWVERCEPVLRARLPKSIRTTRVEMFNPSIFTRSSASADALYCSTLS